MLPAPTKTKIKEVETSKKVAISKMETTTTSSKIEQVEEKQVVKKNLTTEIENGIDYYDLAYAVAMAETKNCQKGFGKEYNNCFGIKNGSTAPCSRIGRKNMCIYNSPSESYVAFKKIWKKNYKKFPNLRLAEIWTGKDRANIWLENVKKYYFERQKNK